jgi:hypothetical protein
LEGEKVLAVFTKRGWVIPCSKIIIHSNAGKISLSDIPDWLKGENTNSKPVLVTGKRNVIQFNGRKIVVSDVRPVNAKKNVSPKNASQKNKGSSVENSESAEKSKK